MEEGRYTMTILSRVMVGLAAVTILTTATASNASAQEFGVRAGASVDPDQFYFGAHVETGPLADRIHFRPNVELGVGNDLTAVAVNLEVVYKAPLRRQPWTFYGGGGPAINFYDTDRGSDTEGGFNLLGGLEHDKGLFFEVKLGLVDSPDFKVGIGYVLGR
jgi:hypothetical protein